MKFLYLLVLGILVGGNSFAQITINRNDMPILGDTIRITNTNASAIDVTQTGADYTWDFLGISSGTQEVLNYKSVVQTPYFLFFPNILTFGIAQPDLGFGPFSFTEMYNFFYIDNGQYSFSGLAFKFMGTPFGANYNRNDRIYNFPLRYGDVDSTTFAVTVDLPGIGRYKSSGYRKTTVDGWGKITTPYGTFDCLRLNAHRNATDSITITFLGFNYSFALPNETWEYQWLAKNQKVPVLSIEGRYVGSTFIVTKAYYRGYPINIPTNTPSRNTATTWSAYPNPGFKGWHLTIDNNWVGGKIEVYNITGKKIQEITVDNSQMYLHMDDQPAGMYVVTLRKGELTESAKLLLAK